MYVRKPDCGLPWPVRAEKADSRVPSAGALCSASGDEVSDAASGVVKVFAGLAVNLCLFQSIRFAALRVITAPPLGVWQGLPTRRLAGTAAINAVLRAGNHLPEPDCRSFGAQSKIPPRRRMQPDAVSQLLWRFFLDFRPIIIGLGNIAGNILGPLGNGTFGDIKVQFAVDYFPQVRIAVEFFLE